jgi:hypothetical protein
VKAKVIKAKVKVVKVEVEKLKLRLTVKKSRTKAGVKTPAVVESLGAEDQPMVVDVEDSEEEVPRRSRRAS